MIWWRCRFERKEKEGKGVQGAFADVTVALTKEKGL
jgi:hypothetical protein